MEKLPKAKTVSTRRAGRPQGPEQPPEKLHPRDRRSPEHERWRRAIGEAMKRRTAQRFRHVLTFRQIAAEWDVPVGVARLLLEEYVRKAGKRSYVPRSVVQRVLGKPARKAAA